MMSAGNRIYMAIDLKSFYASVECVERELDPLNTNLVVADSSKTEKTICLAVSPSLKQYGIGGRARLFEVVQKVKEINRKRKKDNRYREFRGKSHIDSELKNDTSLELGFIIAPPRMAFYIDYSKKIYEVYLKYTSAEDIHVYSIDEVFIDATSYLKTVNKSPREFAKMIIQDIYKTTGITATAGIGTNLYLAKVAMDIVAKHVKADEDGVRIACLDEMRYRKYLWHHQPITDFWRVGKGYAKKLNEAGLYTMGDIAKCSVGSEDKYYNEDLLYDMFGVNAELLIDHAWGYEPCTMKHIKAYKPESSSLGSGQVLSRPYAYDEGRIILKEMIDSLCLDLVAKKLVIDQITVTVGYDKENIKTSYTGEIKDDRHTHMITQKVLNWYDSSVNKKLTIRRFALSANHITDERSIKTKPTIQQMDLFTDYEQLKKEEVKLEKDLEKEKRLQEATLKLKQKYGKNAVLKGMNLVVVATGKDRNNTIGGHKA